MNALLAILLAAAAQDVALTGARIYTLEGDPIDRGTVVLREGKVLSVGADVEIPEGAEVIDVSGHVIIPGLVDAGSFLLQEPSDRGTAGDVHLRAADSLNRFSPRVREPLAAGVTTVLMLPDTAGPARGIAAIVKLPDTVVRPEAGLLLSMAAGSADAVSALETFNQYKALHARIDGAKKYIEMWEKYEKDAAEYETKNKEHEEAKKKAEEAKKDPKAPKVEVPKEPQEPKKPKRDDKNEALARLFVEGKKVGGAGEKLPLLIEAFTLDEIRHAVKLAADFELPFTLVGGHEAHREAEALKKTAVIYGPALVYGAPRARFFGHTAETPARLAKAGVRVCVASLPLAEAGYPRGTGHDASRFLMLSGAEAVAGGLDRKAALRALTLDPAETLGLKERVGSLFPGKDGDLVVLTGEPFDIDTRVKMVFVDGRRGDLLPRGH